MGAASGGKVWKGSDISTNKDQQLIKRNCIDARLINRMLTGHEHLENI